MQQRAFYVETQFESFTDIVTFRLPCKALNLNQNSLPTSLNRVDLALNDPFEITVKPMNMSLGGHTASDRMLVSLPASAQLGSHHQHIGNV